MGSLEINITNRVVTVTVDGVLTREEAVGIIAEHYPKLIDSGCVWDLRRSDVFQLNAADLEAIALTVADAALADGAVDGAPKSAFLVADAKSYTRVCSYLSRHTRMRAKVEAAVFTNGDEAYRWVRGARARS